jgi:hypothetical protein
MSDHVLDGVLDGRESADTDRWLKFYYLLRGAVALANVLDVRQNGAMGGRCQFWSIWNSAQPYPPSSRARGKQVGHRWCFEWPDRPARAHAETNRVPYHRSNITRTATVGSAARRCGRGFRVCDP